MGTVIRLPAPRAIAWHGGRHLLETALLPLALFYTALRLAGFGPAVVVAMAWALGALLVRLTLRRPVPILLVVTTVILAGRTVLGLATGSEFLYFLQPAAQNFLFALVLLATLPCRRPLLARLAADVCAFPDGLAGHPRMVRFFRRASVLWAIVFVLVGVNSLVALLEGTVASYLVISNAGYYLLVGLGVALSLAWFRRALRAERIVLRLGPAPVVAAA